jgi:hypothetical protein
MGGTSKIGVAEKGTVNGIVMVGVFTGLEKNTNP